MNLGCGCDPCYRGSPNQETIPTLDVLPGAGAVHPVGKDKDGATHSPSHRTSDPPPSAARHAPMALIEAYEDQCALAQTAGQEGQDTRSGDGGWMAGWMPQWPGLDAYHPPALVGQAGTLQTLSPGAARPRPVDAATVDAPDDRPIGDNSTVALPGGDGATPQNQANLERGADTRDIDATLEVRPLQAIQVESPSVRPLPVRLQEIPVETPKSPVRTSAHEDPPPSMPLQVSSRGRERLNRTANFKDLPAGNPFSTDRRKKKVDDQALKHLISGYNSLGKKIEEKEMHCEALRGHTDDLRLRSLPPHIIAMAESTHFAQTAKVSMCKRELLMLMQAVFKQS
eukprot:Tamp_08610.p1 GENE.Tamp_08610~~Tamp_08610.p1  ORF type:complete len:341 (-),score=27.18 Tamp_08610:1098-2120(-)